jgi:hypothetical protein
MDDDDLSGLSDLSGSGTGFDLGTALSTAEGAASAFGSAYSDISGQTTQDPNTLPAATTSPQTYLLIGAAIVVVILLT